MRDLSLRSRIVGVFALTLGLASIVLLLWLPSRLLEVEERWSARRAYSLAAAVAHSVEPGLDFDDTTFIEERLRVLETTPDARFALVVSGAGAELGKWGKPGTYPAPHRFRHVEVALHARGGATGKLSVVFDRAELQQHFVNNLGLAAGVLGLVWVVGVAVSYVLGGVIVRPLAALTESARQFGRRDESGPAPFGEGAPFHEDEVRVLRQAFDAMVHRITQQMADLELEKRRAVAAEHQARRASTAKSVFLANMSHELRTPLNVIVGYCEIIDESIEESTPAQIRADLGRAVSSAHHLLAILNDVLDLSKIEAERLELVNEPFSAIEALRAVVAEVEPLVSRNRNRLVLYVPDHAQPMMGDVTRFRQCLLNLLSNAAKFTEDGTVTVTLVQSNDWLRVEVADTGIGVSDEEKARLFQAFVQADPTTTRKFGGTGLGLALTRRLCERMGGSVGMESRVGLGTTVTMTLPTQPSPQSDTWAPPERAALNG